MQNDFNSLFFSYTPHADQRVHEEHLLRDVGLTRNAYGALALAEDPTHLVEVPRGDGWLGRLLNWRAAKPVLRHSAS